MKMSSGSEGLRRWHEGGTADNIPAQDVRIVTSGGRSFSAHSAVLASASPVLESKLDRSWNHRSSERVIQILGVPCEAVVTFIGFLYASKSAMRSGEAEAAMEKYGVHLLVLSHAYRIGWLKKICVDGVAARLTTESVVDVLQLARRCDAPSLYQKCMRFIAKDLESVQRTEAWCFLQKHDFRLELEILQFIQEADQHYPSTKGENSYSAAQVDSNEPPVWKSPPRWLAEVYDEKIVSFRKKQRRREKAEQEIYQQLNEAMDCLNHICTEGCIEVGPLDEDRLIKNKDPCTHFRTCKGLQLLIRHFATCQRKSGKNCPRCKRMWQLFRLHASICDLPTDTCKVPLCKQFKARMESEIKGDDKTWRLLVRKVLIARLMSTLAHRKGTENLTKIWARYRNTK